MAIEERKAEFENVIKSNPDKIAIICEKAPKSQIADIEKSKYLVNGSRDTLEIEQIVMLAYIMETIGNDPTSDVLSVLAGYENEDQYLLPF